MTTIRILQPGDEEALAEFLLPRLASSMFLFANARAGGLQDHGVRPQGTYAAAFRDGRIVAVVGHFWNGNIIPQAPEALDTLWRAAVTASGRAVQGIVGPAAQAYAVRDALGLTDDDLQLNELENLYSLGLDDLRLPAALEGGRLRGRPITDADVPLVSEWSVHYSMEALSETDGPALQARARARAERGVSEHDTWLIELEDWPVAMSSFNASTSEAVQVGGVYTPPELRGRGYARAVVAYSLSEAAAEGKKLAVLFTGRDHVAAHKAYAALGFQVVGDYAIMSLHNPVARMGRNAPFKISRL